MEFGIFDHVESSGRDIASELENRLRLVALYEQLGYHAFFKSEHHSSPLSISPSPVPFLAAASQRTKTLRLGTLVFTLALHDPLRLAEDVCTLDQLSNGRLELGLGRGANLVEQKFFGRDPTTTRELYDEALEILMQGLLEGRLNHKGKFFNYENVPIQVTLKQKPLPPLWMGVVEPRHVTWAVENRSNAVFHGDAARASELIDLYKSGWAAAGNAAGELPHLGVLRYLVVAETDDEALQIARRAYHRYEYNHMHIWRSNNTVDPYVKSGLVKDFDALQDGRGGFAGSPSTVRDALIREINESGANYFVVMPNFGDMTFEESKRTAELFSREVMPALIEAQRLAA